MRTNLDRATGGRDIAALAATGGHHLALEDYESGLVDALTNLLHFARRYDIDFDAELSLAREHHEVEATWDWDEEPGIDAKTPLPHNPLAGDPLPNGGEWPDAATFDDWQNG